MYHRVRAAAERSHVPLEVWVRQAIEECLERESHDLRAEALAALQKLDARTADIDDMLAEIGAGRA
ncbi:MAG: hypothetical protein F4Y74_09670 [Gemmatimonadales bacterium]|nr:hypothetical protein [Gemmatimonadales bacterium]MYG19555.1 hypothetical protein [Gemmatimonadales bacterium]